MRLKNLPICRQCGRAKTNANALMHAGYVICRHCRRAKEREWYAKRVHGVTSPCPNEDCGCRG